MSFTQLLGALLGVLSLLLGVLSWIGLREVRRIDQLERRQAQVVTQPQFEAKLAETEVHRQRWHDEQMSKLNEITTITKSIYAYAADLGRIDERLKRLEDREKYLSDWKHRVVDSYIPRAVDEHERRLNRLEDKK